MVTLTGSGGGTTGREALAIVSTCPGLLKCSRPAWFLIREKDGERKRDRRTKGE